MTEFFSGLIKSDPADLSWLDQTVRCKAIVASDYENWEERLSDPKNSPIPHMRKQLQQRNDCQGQALANGEEKRQWYCTGEMTQLSDIYAYNGSERISGYVGRDQGTSIGSGVRLLVEGIPPLDVDPGLPTENDWPYNTYERSTGRFDTRAKQVKITDSCVTEHGPLPDWEGMLVALAAGGSGHIGTYWPPRWSSVGNHRLMNTLPRGGGGHATEIIWALKVHNEWYLVVWNSHGDRFYLMSRSCYEEMERLQARPFGGYVLMPDKPEERYIDWYNDNPNFS